MKIITINHGMTVTQNVAAALACLAYATRLSPLGISKTRGFKTMKNNAAGDELSICSECEMHLACCMCDWLTKIQEPA